MVLAGSGLGLLVSQLNNYTLAPISEERVSEAAGINSAAGSFGLSFGLAFAGAIMLATLAYTFSAMTQDSNHPDQYRGETSSASGGAIGADDRRPPRPAELIPDEPAA